jgi:hypothetical protein
MHRKLLYRYIGVAVILGLIEAIATYYFLITVSCASMLNNIFSDPLQIMPFLFVMGLVALIAVYLLIHNESVHAPLFLTFLIVWLGVGFLAYLITGTGFCSTPPF